MREGATDEGSHDVWASCCTEAEVWRKESVREGGDRWEGGREGGRKEDVGKGEDIEEDCSEIVGLCGAAAVAVLHLLSHPHSSSSSVHTC